MSKNLPKPIQSDDDFNPTVPDGGRTRADDVESSADLTANFAHIPSEVELGTAAREMFAGLPDSLIRTIIEESEEVAHSTRKILLEHMRIGGNFVHILTGVVGHEVANKGDTVAVRNRAKELVYDYLTKVFRKSKSSVRLYIRCYEKFANNMRAVEILSHSDMALLVGNDIGNNVVDMVIDAKSENPNLSKRQVEQLIANYQDKLAEKANQVEMVTTDLANTVGRLDDAQAEIDRLAAELDRTRQEQARERESSQATSVELANVSKQVSTLQHELAKREHEVKQITHDLAHLKANPLKEQVPVPTVPGEFANLEEALATKLAEVKEARVSLESIQAEKQALEGELQQQKAALEAGEALEKKIRALIEKFGAFAQDYHSAQLLATADGRPARFQPLFVALGDLIGKFHGEVMAATRAA
ncbi:hypothetical protein [Burkholderia ambifaria]|uniref:hypothetical protein n=1 Tax=Burkholderia ambifaria TaxID=152480 RepID=UPI0015896613|nr:hypothetical protein [Burkholderia ambifaria]